MNFAGHPMKPLAAREADGRIAVYVGAAYQLMDTAAAASLRDQLNEALAPEEKGDRMKRTPLARKTPLEAKKPLGAGSIKTSSQRLRQGRSTGKLTDMQSARFMHIRLIGCIACLLNGYIHGLAEVHHLNQGGYHGGKRRGHDYTIGLCGWHHQGRPRAGFNERLEFAFLGPSYKLQKMAFRERYGTDDQLLETQNKLIALREMANG